MLNRAELATFLRTRRNRLRPADVGLPGAGRRRTPGLRRQEVAQLAGISVDYYIRLEQARGPHPSRQVLTAIARALMLTADEREYLFRIAGENPPPAPGPSREITPGIRNLLDSLPETPAYVVDAKYDVLAWNTLATHFIGDLSAVPRDGPEHDPLGVPAAGHRAALDRRGNACGSPGRPSRTCAPPTPVTRPTRAFRGWSPSCWAVSPQFARMWAEHEVESRRPIIKRVSHPMAGPLEFECRVLHVPRDRPAADRLLRGARVSRRRRRSGGWPS